MDDERARLGRVADSIRRIVVNLAASGRDGEHFAVNPHEVARFKGVQRASIDILSLLSGVAHDDLTVALNADVGYVTPKVEVRAFVLDHEERILLVKERQDGFWSVPGGWVDPGDTPSSAVERETREEAGLEVVARKLFACLDRDAQDLYPPMAASVFQLFFLCAPLNPDVSADGVETEAAAWFGIDELPDLSPSRLHSRHVWRAVEHHRDASLTTDFD